jgi:hypothetical protein
MIHTPTRSMTPVHTSFSHPFIKQEFSDKEMVPSRRGSLCAPSELTPSTLTSPLTQMHLQIQSQAPSHSPERIRSKHRPIITDEHGMPLQDPHAHALPTLGYIDTSMSFRAQQQQQQQQQQRQQQQAMVSASSEKVGRSSHYVVGHHQSVPSSPRVSATPRNVPGYWTQPPSADLRGSFSHEAVPVSSPLHHEGWTQILSYNNLGGQMYGSSAAVARDNAQAHVITAPPSSPTGGGGNGGGGVNTGSGNAAVSFITTQGMTTATIAPAFAGSQATPQPASQASFESQSRPEPRRSESVAPQPPQEGYMEMLYDSNI